MREQRWPWLLTAALMLAAAALAAWSTYWDWLPCRGSMLLGSIIQGDDYDGREFSAACLRRMDGEPGPWRSVQVAAMALAGVAWLALVLGLRWQLRTKAVAALPGLATLAFAGAMATGDARLDSLRSMLIFSIELAAVVALVAISAWQPEVRGRGVLRLAVVLWGTTAFGVVHTIVEYVLMINFSNANWDTPPGTGYLTVATITISAILTVIMTLRMPHTSEKRQAAPRPQEAAETR